MSIFFDVSEILQFAINIEENGERFYRHAANVTENDEIKRMFSDLADEEVKHKKTFEELLSKAKSYEPIENYPGEHLGYLRSYVDSIVFTDEVFDREISEIKDAPSALDFGIQRELDSILYYHEIKNFVSGQQNQIDKIIDEERKHFSQLSKLRKKM